MDPVLQAHVLGPLQYGVGGPLSPISIRDQMVRAQLLVERAHASGYIGGNRPLLVVGAGAAGATAAMRAAELRTPTLLIDSATGSFLRQVACTSRFIDPVQYDWPIGFWTATKFPPFPPLARVMPLSLKAGFAVTLARTWRNELNDARVRSPWLRVKYKTQLTSFKPSGSFLLCGLSERGVQHNAQFGLLLGAVGPGSERVTTTVRTAGGTTAIGYEGPRFWETDALEDASLGLSSAGVTLLISGGGDGALQDFIRAVSGKRSAREALEAIATCDPRVSKALNMLISSLQAAEDHAARGYSWSTPERDHDIHKKLHLFHDKVVTEIERQAFWAPIATLVNQWLNSRRWAALHFVYPCGHFGQCYALNRFLTLLLLRASRSKVQAHPFSSVSAVNCTGGRVANVSGASRHVDTWGMPGFKTCNGQKHVVVIEPHACPKFSVSGHRAQLSADVVVLRHGVEPSASQLAKAPALGRTRHFYPYWLD